MVYLDGTSRPWSFNGSTRLASSRTPKNPRRDRAQLGVVAERDALVAGVARSGVPA